MTAPSRLRSLDGLRTVAVLAVMAFHFAPTRVVGGAIGVDVFFVISGFVITRMLLSEQATSGRIDLLRFLRRRMSRLAPALLLLVAVLAVLSVLFPTGVLRHAWLGGLVSAAYLMDFARAFGWFGSGEWADAGYLTGHTWSLAVEEQFYLVWPVILLAALRLRVAPALVAGILLFLPLAQRFAISPPADYSRLYGVDVRVDQILMGCLLACVLPELARRQHARRLASWVAGAAGLALLLQVAFLPSGALTGAALVAYYTYGISVVGLIATLLVAGLVLAPDGPLARGLAWRPLAWTGMNLSYGLYLWHYPINFILKDVGATGAVRLIAMVGATTLAAFVSYRFVERRVHRLRPASLLEAEPSAGVAHPEPGAPGSHSAGGSGPVR